MYRIYQVNSGDTLGKIAEELNTTVEILKSLNGINDNMILMPGSFIVVPKTDQRFKTYIVKQGDTIYKIATMYNISPDLLLRLNGLNKEDYIYPNQEILVPNGEYKFYITEKNEPIESVVKRLGIDYKNLIDNNEDIYLMEDQLLIYK